MMRIMRLLVFFDLPVQQKEERKVATQFRKFLLNDGFYMLQFSVYCRICSNLEAAKVHEKRIQQQVPVRGSVRVLTITDKQYMDMKIMLGGQHPNDKHMDDDMITFL